MKHIKPIILFFTALLISTTISCSENSNSLLVDNWEILYEQDSSLETIQNKTGWKPINIPSIFKLPNPPIRDYHFVWLRGEFDIKNDPSRYFGLSTGRVRYSDKIFINNHLIGSLPPKKVNWASSSRNYIIPKGVLKKGANIVYIHLGIYDKYYGGISDDVLIQPEEEFEQRKFIDYLKYNQLPTGIVVLLGFSTLTFFISFLLDRKEKIHLIASSLCLVGFMFMLFPLFSERLISFELCNVIQLSTAIAVIIIFFMLSQAFYRIYLLNHNRIIVPLLLLFILIIILSRNEPNNDQIAIVLIILSIIIIIPFFVAIMYRMHSINPDKFLLYTVSLIFFSVIFVVLFEIYQGIIGGLNVELLVTYSPLYFTILGVIVTTRESKKRKKELDSVYKKLGKHEDKDLSITDAQEEELKRVIDFIKENYKSDLSREGLAAAVGIHPNYFGRLFKLYTGLAVNDYINRLRVNEAIRFLEEKDTKIIDIASSVGFESIVTFNRVFKKETGKTPSEYKKNKQ